MHTKQIFIQLFLWSLIGITAKAQIDCEPGTGAVWGSEAGNERGKSLAALPEFNGFIVAGLKEDSVLLLRCNLDGVIEWTRTFDIVENKEEHVTAIFIDDEGMLAVAGIAGNQILGGTTFIFRYDLVTHQILWAREYVSSPNNYCFSMISLGVGKNYVISNNPHYNAESNNDAELIEIDKSNGNVVPSFSKNYSLGSSEEINQMTIHDGYIYGSGRYSDGPQPENMRNTLVKIDPTDGTHVWARMGHIPSQSSARLYGEGLVIDQDYIYATYQGDPIGTSTLNTKVFIQKSGLEGNIIWIKQYELPGPNEVSFGIIKSGNGFVVLAGNRSAPGVFYLFKVDENGMILWANQYVFSSFITSVHLDRGVSQFIEAGDKLVFTGHGFNASGKTDLILVVADLNGEVQTECVESRPIVVQALTINNPVFYQVEPSEFVFIPETRNVIAKSQISTIALREECSTKDTLYMTLDIVICEGESYEGYTQPGTYIDEYTTLEGCDSIRTLHLSVNPLVLYTFSKGICVGDSFEGYTQTGIFSDTFQIVAGCDSIRILDLRVISCDPLVHYDLDACNAYMHTGTNMDYSEFIPMYPTTLVCSDMNASIVFRAPPQENKHSCTPGLHNSPAMCVSTLPSCAYSPGHQASVVFEVSFLPNIDSIAHLTAFHFYEKSPGMYSWIDGGTGLNNYPTKYGIRVLKNGIEIFRLTDITTNVDWTLQQFDFVDNDAFRIDQPTTFRFELLSYCPVGNGAEVSAWDLEDLVIYGGCLPVSDHQSGIEGTISTSDFRPIAAVQVQVSEDLTFSNYVTSESDSQGQYSINTLRPGESYYVKGNKNDDFLNGVSTLDLIQIQKHLLGIDQFTSLDQFVAADINNNGVINVIDLVDLRKALLGKIDAFPNNASWRFCGLPTDLYSDQLSSFIDIKQIERLELGMTTLHFMGVKVGDLNHDVQTILDQPLIRIRNEEEVTIQIPDKALLEGSTETIEIVAESDLLMEGIQFSLKFKHALLLGVSGGEIPIDVEHYAVSSDGVLTISWNNYPGKQVSRGSVLMRILMLSERDGALSERIQLTEQRLSAEVYADGKSMPIDFQIMGSSAFPSTAESPEIRIQPNPTTDEAKLTFTLDQSSRCLIRFISPSGAVLHTVDKVFPAGENTFRIGRKEITFGNGIVTCQFISGEIMVNRRVVFLQ